MIAIVNTGTVKHGEHVYRLQINDEVIAQFTHKREDGLEVCLEKAAQAAKNGRLSHLVGFITAFNEGSN